jgi:allantoicase
MAHHKNELIEWDLISYSESGFTDPHDLVSPLPAQDGRGQFTHLGVKMEGLESRRHLNFNNGTTSDPSGTRVEFWFDQRPDHPLSANVVVLRTKGGKPALIKQLEFDTSYYTRNNVRLVHSVHLFSCPPEEGLSRLQPATLLHGSTGLPALLTDQHEQVVSGLALQGDSVKRVQLTDSGEGRLANCCVLRLSEGGLTRFKAWGYSQPNVSDSSLQQLLKSAVVFGCSDASYGDPQLALRPQREGLF